ncbi:MAG TPA: hypothetical protein VGK20_11945 [Candidatus Binatia bacterium]
MSDIADTTDAPEPADRRRRRGRLLPAILLVAATASALWLVWPAFSPGHIVNLDAPRHLLRTIVMARQFLPSGHLDGWSPYWFLGAQLFLFQSYGYFLLIAATSLLAAHYASIEAVFKVFYVLPLVVLPAATALLAWRLGAGRRGAAFAAAASLVFSSPLGYGTQGMFGMGLLLQGVGLVGFAVAWPEMLDVLVDPGRAPWRACLALAALLLCHFISGAYALAVSGFVAAGVALRTRSAMPLARYALVAAVVLLLAAHALVPSVELHDLAGGTVGWGDDRDRYLRFVLGTLFGAPWLAHAALVAALWAMWRGSRTMAIAAVVFVATGLIGGSNGQPWEPHELAKLLEVMVRPRALPYAALLQAVFVGVAADGVLAAADRAASRFGWRSIAIVANAVVLAAFVVVAAPEIQYQRHWVKTMSMLKPRDHKVYDKLVHWLRAHARPPQIVAIPRTVLPQSALGARSIISLLNVDTGLYTLHGDQSELSRTAHHAGRINFERFDDNLPRSAATLRTSGVSLLIVSRPGLRRHLDASAEFERVFEYDQNPAHLAASAEGREPKIARRTAPSLGIAVYRLQGGGQWLHGGGIDVHAMRAETPEHIEWDVAVKGHPLRVATVAINWHPYWTVRIDGAPVAASCTPSRRISFEVPAGATRIALEFERPAREKSANAVSALTLVVVVAAWWRTRRRRTRLPAQTEKEGRGQV